MTEELKALRSEFERIESASELSRDSEALKPPTIQLTASLMQQAEDRAMQVFSYSVM